MRRRFEVPDHHRRVSRALGSGGPAMPDSLLRELELLDWDAPAGPRPRPRLALVGAVAAAAAIVVALVVSLVGGGSTAVDATELSERPSEGPAPAPAPERPELLTRSFAGVTYPNWREREELRWRAVGQRTDDLAGRRTATVFYRHTHHRIGYTVIAGSPIAPPKDAERIVADGLVLHRFRVGRQDAVTFVRNGRTCVLSGDVQDPDTLVKLAAWNKGGLRSS